MQQDNCVNMASEVPVVGNLRIPEFLPEDPEVWICQLEAIFQNAGITSQSAKYTQLVAAIPRSLISDVRDLILHPPKQNPYSTLKNALLTRASDSEEKRIKQLLHSAELGDRKPSQLLRHMQQIAGNLPLDCTLLKQLWLQRLPDTVRAILSVLADKTSLEDLAATADKAFESFPQSSAYAISCPTQCCAQQDLIERLDALTLKVDSLTEAQSQPRRRHSPKRSNFYNNNCRSYTSGTPICWYHQQYKSKARKCIQPCMFNSRAKDSTIQQISATPVSYPKPRRLPYVTEKSTGTHFLVDTAAQVSLLPCVSSDLTNPCHVRLRAANGTCIHTYGTHKLTLDLGLSRKFEWQFIIADVPDAILGADFLDKYGMSIDFGKRCLVDTSGDVATFIDTVDQPPAARLRQIPPTIPVKTITKHCSHPTVSVGVVQHIRTIVPCICNKQRKSGKANKSHFQTQKPRVPTPLAIRAADELPASKQRDATNFALNDSKPAAIQHQYTSTVQQPVEAVQLIKPSKPCLAVTGSLADPPDPSKSVKKHKKHVRFA